MRALIPGINLHISQFSPPPNFHHLCVDNRGCRNAQEWNGTGSNCCTIQTWTPDMLWKLSTYGELISRSVPATKMGQAPSRQNFYLESSSAWCRRPLIAYKRVVGDVTPVSKLLLIQPWGVALTPLWLILEQKGTGTAFCTLHTYENKYHQRAPDGMSTSSELGQLLAHRDVLPIYG